jgi:hypothetical protein
MRGQRCAVLGLDAGCSVIAFSVTDSIFVRE